MEQQSGEEKAEYAIGLIKELSEHMTRDFGKWLTTVNLKICTNFILHFQMVTHCVANPAGLTSVYLFTWKIKKQATFAK